VPVFAMRTGSPEDLARAALHHARTHAHDVILVDSAGRLHTDDELMDELKRLKRALQPHEALMVLDATTGQDAVRVAETFDSEVGITGVILTKLDSDARGGAVLSVRAVTGKPVKFVGTGEHLSDLEIFHPDRMAARILGLGDVSSLMERVEGIIDEATAKRMEERLAKGTFGLDDLLLQLPPDAPDRSVGATPFLFAWLKRIGRTAPANRRGETQTDGSHHPVHDTRGAAQP